jgi:hypothetical protein
VRKRLLLLVVVVFVASWLGSMSGVVEACPMCQIANESKASDVLPRAYMYSILFMLAVPTSLATGFGIGFYRLSKQQPRGPLPGEELVDHHLEPQ